jgi:hypothetical protein
MWLTFNYTDQGYGYIQSGLRVTRIGRHIGPGRDLASETWRFAEFLYVLVGPILLLFATKVLLSSAAIAGTEPAETEDDSLISARFLVIVLVFQAWLLLANLLFVGELGPGSIGDALFIAILLSMLLSRKRSTHVAGTIAAVVVYTVSLTLVGLGIL